MCVCVCVCVLGGGGGSDLLRMQSIEDMYGSLIHCI